MKHAEQLSPRSTVELCLRISAVIVLFFLTCYQAGAQQSPELSAASYSADAIGYEPPPADLLLDRDHERKAEALARFVQGMLYEEKGERDRMISSFRRTLDLEPANVDLAEKVAFELIRRGDVPDAIEVLKDAVKAEPNEVRPYLYLAGIYSRDLGKHGTALKYARSAQDIDNDNPEVYRVLHEILVSTGQPEEAAKLLNQAGESKSKDPDFWLWLAEFQTRLLVKSDGTTPQADIDKLVRIYKRVLEGAPDNMRVLNAVADFYVYTRDVKSAIPLYLRILKSHTATDTEFLGNVREKLARSLLLSGDRKQAVKVLEDLVRTNPLNHEAYEFLGQLYEESGDFEKALPNYEQCLLLEPSRPVNSLRVADMQLRLGKVDGAVVTLKEARRRFPDIIQISYSLAIAYTQAKEFGPAITAFESAYQDAQKTNPQFLTAGFFFNYGIGAERAGLFEKAVGLFKKCIEMEPENAGAALNYLGYMWIDRGENLAEAEQLILQAMELEPGSSAYTDSLGWLYYKQGNYAKALTQLLEAERLIEEGDPVVYDHIADTYKELGDLSQALVYWQKALALAPDDETITAKIDGAKQKVTSTSKP